MKRTALVVYFACLCSVMPLGRADAAPTPTIVTCNFPVTQSIIVQNSLFGCPDDGLRVMADNVTIDLNGHIIDGNATDDLVGVLENGVTIGNHTGVVLKNGTLRDFEFGMSAGGGGVVQEVTAVDNGVGFFISSSIGESWTVRRNTAAGSVGLDGFGPYGFLLSGRGDVVGNLATDNGQDGFAGGKSSGVVRNNRAVSNGQDGFSMTVSLPASMRRNTAIGNGEDGFSALGSGPSLYVENVASGNRSDGFEFSNSPHRLEANRAEGNSTNGFLINSGSGHRLIGNVAKGNGSNGVLINQTNGPTSDVKLRGNNASGNRGDGVDLDVDTLKVVENVANRNGFDNGDDDGSGLGIRDSGSTDIVARRNRADGNADANECSSTMGCV